MFENRLCFGVDSEGNGTRCCACAHSSLLVCPSSHPFHTQILDILASLSPNSVFSEVNPGVLGSKCHWSVSSESGAAAPVLYLGVHPVPLPLCSVSPCSSPDPRGVSPSRFLDGYRAILGAGGCWSVERGAQILREPCSWNLLSGRSGSNS